MIQKSFHIEVLHASGNVAYFDGSGLTSDRDDACEYSNEDEAAEDHLVLRLGGLDASIEASAPVRPFIGHNSASRIERRFLGLISPIAAE